MAPRVGDAGDIANRVVFIAGAQSQMVGVDRGALEVSFHRPRIVIGVRVDPPSRAFVLLDLPERVETAELLDDLRAAAKHARGDQTMRCSDPVAGVWVVIMCCYVSPPVYIAGQELGSTTAVVTKAWQVSKHLRNEGLIWAGRRRLAGPLQNVASGTRIGVVCIELYENRIAGHILSKTNPRVAIRNHTLLEILGIIGVQAIRRPIICQRGRLGRIGPAGVFADDHRPIPRVEVMVPDVAHAVIDDRQCYSKTVGRNRAQRGIRVVNDVPSKCLADYAVLIRTLRARLVSYELVILVFAVRNRKQIVVQPLIRPAGRILVQRHLAVREIIAVRGSPHGRRGYRFEIPKRTVRVAVLVVLIRHLTAGEIGHGLDEAVLIIAESNWPGEGILYRHQSPRHHIIFEVHAVSIAVQQCGDLSRSRRVVQGSEVPIAAVAMTHEQPIICSFSDDGRVLWPFIPPHLSVIFEFVPAQIAGIQDQATAQLGKAHVIRHLPVVALDGFNLGLTAIGALQHEIEASSGDSQVLDLHELFARRKIYRILIAGTGWRIAVAIT